MTFLDELKQSYQKCAVNKEEVLEWVKGRCRMAAQSGISYTTWSYDYIKSQNLREVPASVVDYVVQELENLGLTTYNVSGTTGKHLTITGWAG